MLIPLPDVPALLVARHLPICDIIKLMNEDFRIYETFVIMNKKASVIKRCWKRMKTGGRDYGDNIAIHSVTDSWRCMYQIYWLSSKVLKFHTVLPRIRKVFRGCETVAVSECEIACEFSTIPHTKMVIVSDGCTYEVTENSVIPLYALRSCQLELKSLEKPSYLCYTAIYMDGTATCDTDRPICCINMAAMAMDERLHACPAVNMNSHLVPC